MSKAFLVKVFKYSIIAFSLCFALNSAAKAEPICITPSTDLNTIISNLASNFEKINNFKCTLNKFERLGSKTDYRTYRYFFLKPRLIRMEVIKGKNKGSVAVYKDGKVRARRGGIFKPLVITCKPTDQKVTSLRGGTIVESDWQNIVEKLRSYLAGNRLKLRGIESRNGSQAYLIEVEGINEDGITRRHLWIDASTYLPLSTQMYEGDVLVNSMDYSNIVVNTQLPGELFNL